MAYLRSALRRLAAGLTPRGIALVASAFSVLGFVLAVVAYAKTNAYSSDDVAIQNVLRSLESGEAFAPIVGGDNFAIKVPLYVLVDALLVNGRTALTVTALACNIPLVGAMLLVTYRVAAPFGRVALIAAYLIVAWFLVATIAPQSSLMIPNGRNGEIGIVVLVIWWWSQHLRGRLDLALRAIGVPLLGALFFSDGFFLFVVGSAAVLVAVLAWVLRMEYATRAVAVALGVAASAGLAYLLTGAARAGGLVVLQNYANTVPDAAQVPALMGAAIGAVLRNLNASTAGLPLASVPAAVCAQVLLGSVLLAGLVLLIRSGRLRRDLWSLSAITMIGVSALLYVFTSNAADVGNYRYMLFATVLLVLTGATGVAATSWRRSQLRAVRLVGAVGLVASLLSICVNATAVLAPAADPQARSRSVVNVVESQGLSVGLGQYWDANITTYLSENRIHVIPQDCSSGRMLAHPWLINAPEMSRRASRMFVVLSAATGCTPKVVQATFGVPVARIPLAGQGTDAVWVYDRSLR